MAKKKVAKKAAAKKPGALAKRDSVGVVVLQRRAGIEALSSLAQVFSGKMEVSPKVVGEAYNSVYMLSKANDDILAIAKKYITDMVKATGERITDKGSMVARIGDFRFEMRPTRTGPDPKKLEALLRTKGAAIEAFMEQRVTFAVSDEGIQRALEQGVLTTAELDTVQYGESFALQPPVVALGDEG